MPPRTASHPRIVAAVVLAALLPLVIAATAHAQPAPASADAEALRAAYRTFEAGMAARSLDAAAALLAPSFEHRALDGKGGHVVTPRAAFVERLRALPSRIDSLVAFRVDVSAVDVRGDSADVSYAEHVDAVWKPRAGGRAAVRDSSTTWWRDRWVRTPAGWRALVFQEVEKP